MASDIGRAAALDDVYRLVELTYRYKLEPERLAEIAAALEKSIPLLDPVQKRRELAHVLTGPDIPQLARAKEMVSEILRP